MVSIERASYTDRSTATRRATNGEIPHAKAPHRSTGDGPVVDPSSEPSSSDRGRPFALCVVVASGRGVSNAGIVTAPAGVTGDVPAVNPSWPDKPSPRFTSPASNVPHPKPCRADRSIRRRAARQHVPSPPVPYGPDTRPKECDTVAARARAHRARVTGGAGAVDGRARGRGPPEKSIRTVFAAVAKHDRI